MGSAVSKTVKGVIHGAHERPVAAGIENPDLDVRLLVQHVQECKPLKSISN
jgi:hypothetical protein